VLRLLRDHHNVLIKGPPGTGKTRLLNEVATAFLQSGGAGVPVLHPGARVAIPDTEGQDDLAEIRPAPARTGRKVFRTVFHQNSKHREFLTGLVPRVQHAPTAGGVPGGGTQFMVQEGTLYRASEHAKTSDGASLLIIDEINRGPAVQLFGGALVPFENDKRLLESGAPGPQTVSFELVSPPAGETNEYQLPFHLYTLAAMNEADTSVEPLDVAFLRRWRPYALRPDAGILQTHYGIATINGAALPEVPVAATDVYHAAIAAWNRVNERICRGRGPEFQIGHGVLIESDAKPTGVAEAAALMYERWTFVQAHIEEVFFGDVRAVAEVLGATDGTGSHPYKLEEHLFADQVRFELRGPLDLNADRVYDVLRAVATSE
jgi:5-methylcytosine-specific restriction protein B